MALKRMKEKDSTATKNASSSTSYPNKTENDNVEGVGQGKLYSPGYGIKVSTTTRGERQEGNSSEREKEEMGVAADVRRKMGVVKDKVLEKLFVASVPSDALDNARNFLESVVRDVTVAAHGLTKDALNRIKTHLVDIIPSLSPALTTKMVDDAEKEANGECEKAKGEEIEEGKQRSMRMKVPFASPNSSFFAALAKPLSRL